MLTPKRRHKSLRLASWDYASPGLYYVTICVQDKSWLFGQVMNGEMTLSEIGRMVEKWWLELDRKFPHVKTDLYIVMPNHFHGIIGLLDYPIPQKLNNRVGADCSLSSNEVKDVRPDNVKPEDTHVGVSLPDSYIEGENVRADLGDMMQWFKTMSTNEYFRGVKLKGWPEVNRRLWQTDYYERIIRNESDLSEKRNYIMNNPLNWESDDEYTA